MIAEINLLKTMFLLNKVKDILASPKYIRRKKKAVAMHKYSVMLYIYSSLFGMIKYPNILLISSGLEPTFGDCKYKFNLNDGYSELNDSCSLINNSLILLIASVPFDLASSMFTC